LERILRISKEQKDYAETNLNDLEEIGQFVQDHNFIMNTHEKVELLMEHRLSELVNINSNFHDHPQHNIILNSEFSKLGSANVEYMKFDSSIQKRCLNQILEELMKDVMNTIQKKESHKFFVKFQTPLQSTYFAIHLYLATVINFLHSNKIITTEITRKIFADEKCLSWIIQLNTSQLLDQFPFSFIEGYTDITNQWFWTFKWKFLTGMLICFIHQK
jgi:hypothetical protein